MKQGRPGQRGQGVTQGNQGMAGPQKTYLPTIELRVDVDYFHIIDLRTVTCAMSTMCLPIHPKLAHSLPSSPTKLPA